MARTSRTSLTFRSWSLASDLTATCQRGPGFGPGLLRCGSMNAMPLKPVFDPRQQVADRLIQPLREGKPELGWSGDPDLVLVFERISNRWELWRHEPLRGHQDRHVMIAKGPVGQDLNEDAINLLIMRLRDADTHRDGNSAEALVERALDHNDRVTAEANARAADAIAEPLATFYHEAGVAFGVTKTQFGF